MVNFFSPNPWQMMTLLHPLNALMPKIPVSFFAEFWVRATSGARGSVSVGFCGSRQLSPFRGGGGPSQRAVSTPAPPPPLPHKLITRPSMCRCCHAQCTTHAPRTQFPGAPWPSHRMRHRPTTCPPPRWRTTGSAPVPLDRHQPPLGRTPRRHRRSVKRAPLPGPAGACAAPVLGVVGQPRRPEALKRGVRLGRRTDGGPAMAIETAIVTGGHRQRRWHVAQRRSPPVDLPSGERSVAEPTAVGALRPVPETGRGGWQSSWRSVHVRGGRGGCIVGQDPRARSIA